MDAGSFQAGSAGLDVTVLKMNLCAHGFESLEMQVNRPRANSATAGQADPGFTITSQQRAKNQNRCTHGTHQFIRSFHAVDLLGRNFQGAVTAVHLGAELCQ